MRDIPKFPIHYHIYRFFAKRGTHDKISLFFASKIGTSLLKRDSWQVCKYDYEGNKKGIETKENTFLYGCINPRSVQKNTTHLPCRLCDYFKMLHIGKKFGKERIF